MAEGPSGAGTEGQTPREGPRAGRDPVFPVTDEQTGSKQQSSSVNLMQAGQEPACETHVAPSAREGHRVGGVAFPESVPSGIQDRPGTSFLPRGGVNMSIVWAAHRGWALTGAVPVLGALQV